MGEVGEAGGGAARCVLAHLANHVSPHSCCRLRPVDVEFMKALHEKVNIVPLIAKADCLIPSEIRKLKERVRCCFSTGAYLMWWRGYAEKGEKQYACKKNLCVYVFIVSACVYVYIHTHIYSTCRSNCSSAT